MTVRRVLKCRTCGEYLIVKIQVIREEREEYSFECPFCRENLKYAIDAGNETLSPVKNCEDITFGDGKDVLEGAGNVVYLSNDIPCDENQFRDFPYSPVAMYMARMANSQTKILNRERIKKSWDCFYSIYRQHTCGRKDLADRLLQDFQLEFSTEPVDLTYGVNDSLFCVLYSIIQEFDNVRNSIDYIMEQVRKFDHGKLLSCENYLKRMFNKELPSVVEICNKFFEHYDELHLFIQTMLDGDSVDDLGYQFSLSSGVVNLYADIFEKMGDMMLFYIFYINLREDRDFDLFERNGSIDLYLNSDKSTRRLKIFNRYDEVKYLTTEYDPEIRNAINHSQYKIDYSQQTLELHITDGRPKRVVSIKEFLRCTCTIFLEFATLLCLMMLLIEQSKILKERGVCPS